MNQTSIIKLTRQTTRPFLHSVKVALMWVRYLQVPILAAAAAAGLALSAAMGVGPASLVLGAYDGSIVMTIPVALTAILFCFAMWDISMVILRYGPDRFNLDEEDINPGRAWQRWIGLRSLGVLFGCVPGLTLLACHRAAEIHWWGWLAWVTVFLLVWWCYCQMLKWSKAGIARMVSFFDVLTDISTPGYRWKKDARGIGYGHVRSALLLVICGLVGLILGFLPTEEVPAAMYALLTLMGIAWVCSALGFFFWRHQVPLVLVLGLWVGIGGWLSHTDYSYKVVELAAEKELPSAYDVLSKAPPERRIAVAAVGGGIHSGAWGVEVLTRLQEICKCRDLPDRLCAISGTSGGSYGAMHYAHAIYHDEAMKQPKAQTIMGTEEKLYLAAVRDAVRAPSLGSVVHALAYHDLPGYLAPFWFGNDRGTAMEKQWAANATVPRSVEEDERKTKVSIGRDEDLANVTLSQWGEEALKGTMPAILFTSGTEESGRPVIYGSSKVWDWNWNAERVHGEHKDSMKHFTVPVVTGARLSASFPFVTPAARPAAPDGQLLRVEHQMDGGYYDNYGLVALNRWLQEGLSEIDEVQKKKTGMEKPPWDDRFKRFLVIQIRYKKSGESKESKSGTPDVKKGGFFYQMFAPLTGLYQARVAGQSLRADEQFDVFSRYWKGRGVEIHNAAFEFEENEEAPLSWRLTQKQKLELDAAGRKILDDYTIYAPLRKDLEERKNTASSDEEKRKRAIEIGKLGERYPLGAAAYVVAEFISPRVID
jgi:hypothetical protein